MRRAMSIRALAVLAAAGAIVSAPVLAGAQAGRGAAAAEKPPAATVPAAPTLESVIRGLETAYGKMSDLKGEFSQTAFNKSLNQTIPAHGTMYMKRGGKLRWEYVEPTPQQIVSDGKTLWVYTPSLNQVNVGDAPEALAGPAGSFLAGLGRVREHFEVRFLNPAQPRADDGTVVLDLTPKAPQPTLTRLLLSLDPAGWQVRRAVLYDQFDNTVTMQFAKLAVNSGLADTLFTFAPPKGAATVPLR
jgi:outer membrane lipoprotein carrier protein